MAGLEVLWRPLCFVLKKKFSRPGFNTSYRNVRAPLEGEGIKKKVDLYRNSWFLLQIIKS